MPVHVQILDGALPPHTGSPVAAGAGALVVFEGIVRDSEDSRRILGLDYETYDPMAQQQLEQLAATTLASFKLIALDVTHSRGYVAVGECSFRLLIASAHRKEALAAMDHFIDALKRDVPIWKKPRFAVSDA